MKKLATLLLTLLAATLITGCSNKSLEIKRLRDKLEIEERRSTGLLIEVDKLKDDKLELSAQIDSLNREIVKLTQGSSDLKVENADLKNQLANSKTSSSSSASSSNSSNANINDLRNQINVLNADLSNYKTKCEILQQQLDSQIAVNKNYTSTSYLSVKFWSDGNTYSCKTTWYSDIACTKKIANDVVITSPIVDAIEQSNGYTAYCCMSTTGLVYSSSRPYLSVVKN